ncbi:MAG: RES family NAD+ phosphorylase [Actinobacteria bacterium]|nr:RES family NAD+ phosphorylase [Actinomycetota bacterium]
MYCCATCFGDSFLDKRIPEISKQIGKCGFCYAINVVLIEPTALLDYFQSVSSIYAECFESDAKPLIEWFKDDWQIFSSLDQINAKALLGEILDDGEIVRKEFVVRDVPVLGAVEKWATFRDEIMRKNRFFFQHDLDLDSLKELFDTYLETDASEFGGLLYRARIQLDNSGIPLDEMGCPSAEHAKNGRANPVGIPYLYVATTPETAIAETRPHPGDQLSVAQFEVTTALRLLNLMNPRKTISPFSVVSEDELRALRYDLEFLCHLENELSKPVLPRVADLEYLPTQYLCEFIKNCGYDGVVYKSSISNGANVALFDDSKVQAEELTQYEVTKLIYEQEQRQAL